MNNDFIPIEVTPPGATIVDWILENKYSMEEFRLSLELDEIQFRDLLLGHYIIGNWIATKLYWITKVPIRFWINRENNYRCYIQDLCTEI